MTALRAHVQPQLRRFRGRNIAIVFAAALAFALLQLDVTSAAVTATPDQVGQWSAPASWPIVAVHMSLDPDGRVLAWDGFADAPNSERIWDPASGTFLPVAYGRNLFCAGHVGLADGRTLILGGHITADNGLADTTIFDSTNNTWFRGPDMSVGRWYPTATLLPDGRTLVFSGDNIVQDRPGVDPPFEDASVNSLPEIYNPKTNTWTDLASSTMTSPLYPFMFVLSDGRIFNAGPDKTSHFLTPGSWTWSNGPTSTFDGMSAVMYRPDKIMKSGSWADPDFKGSKLYNATSQTAVIDLSQPSPTWRSTAPMHFARAYHNLTLLPDGTVFTSGGESASDGVDLSKAVLPAEIWNPDTETWTQVASLQNGREYHSTALLLPDGRVLMAGGGQLPNSGATNQTNAEIYSPPYLFKGARPTITSAPTTFQYGTNFTITTPNAASIAKVALIRTPSVTHAFDQNQRYVPLTFTQGSGQLTVTAPANARVAPPGDYMLFILDGNGIPSVAKITRALLPTDTTPPTISITSPTAGATLSGTVNVTANASDNDAVAQVQFKLDGSNLGSPDTTAPYSYSWDSATATNGSHTLTAVATDASGNTTTSSGVLVTVANTFPSGLVAAYSFDEGTGTTAADVTGHGNTGTTANTTWAANGKFGEALSFNGTNSWVTVPDSNSLDLTRMTLEAWVDPTALGTAWRTVLFKEQTGDVTYSLYANRNTQVPDAQVDIGGERNVTGTAQIPLNTWTHLAATYDGSTLKVYVNGAQAGSFAIAGNIAVSSGALRIGGNGVYGEYFSGLIDEVRVYSRALSQAEIQADMTKALGAPDTTPPSTPTGFTKSGSTATSISTSWTASTDNAGVASYNLYDGATKVGTVPGTSYTFTGLGCGTSHNLAVEAVDTSGNVSTSKATLTASTNACDTTPPTVSITAPAGGTTVSGSVAVNANAADNDSVVGVQFKLDGANLQTEDTSSPYGVLWDTTTASNGSHTLTAVARDPSNNTATSASVTVTVSNVAPPPPPTGLVAAYSFDAGSGTTVGDLSGNGNTGTITNATWTTTGKFGGALSFNGTDAWVTVPDSASLHLTTGMTLEAWVDPTTLGSSWRTAVFKEQTGNYAYALYANTGTGNPSANGIIGGNDDDTRAASGIPLNTWTHLAATYDGANLKLYVNGAQAASLAASGNILTSTGALRIGGNNIWPEWFSGQIDEVRVYNKALTQAEIQADMNKAIGAADTTPPSTPTGFAKAGSTATSISTSWTASTDNVAVASYNLYDGATKVGTVPGTSYTFTGLGCGTSHNLAVEAVDSSGNVSTSRATLSASTNACDTIPPTVSIAAPVTGTTVSGSVAVNANASDNNAVAGVQFKLDGNNLQAEDTTSPYGILWDTTTATNGTHTLTAVAHDPSNNTTTSAAVTVTVNNVGPPPPTGLVAAYGFEEGAGTTTADKSGTGNNGTVANATWTTAGKVGNALSFNGTNAWVTVPDSSSLDLTTGMTLEAWVKPDALGSSWRTVIFKEQGGNTVYDLYANATGSVPFTSVYIGGEEEVRGPSALPLNTWTHLAATYDGSALRLYVNGTQVASLAQGGSILTSTGALRIGGNNIWSEWFSGQIDEVRIYNRALGQTEIQSDMTTPVG
jgi:chitodextrinase